MYIEMKIQTTLKQSIHRALSKTINEKLIHLGYKKYKNYDLKFTV